ncbi:MAG TPA: carbon-nitrogen hydrolase family protein [Pyrinomonadaceae bacterium]|nr:carbon-nitrogen hydrolase family protein [Pyrinomonadaceae bacterium]
MENALKVALLQLKGHGFDRQASLAEGEAACRSAHAKNADIALFPELWSVGMNYFNPKEAGAKEFWASQAIARDHPFIIHFQQLAKELNMAIALTYLEQWENAPRNSVSLIDREGKIVLTYAKVHTCEFDIEAALTPGDGFPVSTLATQHGDVKVGCMICYDREFPESARVLMLQGAELILTPNACTLDHHRLGQFKARAFENMVAVAMTNYAAPQNNGHSVAYDPIVYPVPDGDARDTLVVEAREEEGVFIAPFDLNRIREYRARETWGNSYRRPRLYHSLTATNVDPPFVRHDATR